MLYCWRRLVTVVTQVFGSVHAVFVTCVAAGAGDVTMVTTALADGAKDPIAQLICCDDCEHVPCVL